MISRAIQAACGLVMIIGLFANAPLAAATETDLPETARGARFRRPIAVCFSEDAKFVYAVNQQSGTISIVDVTRRRLVDEVSIGKRLSAATVWRPNVMAVADEQLHCVHLVYFNGRRLRMLGSIAAPRYPVAVQRLDDGHLLVSGLWSRRVARLSAPPTLREMLVALQQGSDVHGEQSADGKSKADLGRAVVFRDRVADADIIDMPWAPRCLLPLPEQQKLVVGDAFGGRLGIVDLRAWKLEYVREFPAHNIRGLELSVNGEKIVIAHQMLNDLAQTVRNDVHWGLLMSNDLRYMPIKTLLNRGGDIYQFAHMHPLGEAGNATSDPSGLVVAKDGTAVVTLGGVGEIALGTEDEFSLTRLHVGKRPTGVAASNDSKWAATADTFGDSVTLIRLDEREAVATISLGEQPRRTLVEQGERLFYDGELSHDRWMSCHSCHPDGHTNGQRNDNLSDFQTFGAPKRVLSLLGKRGTAPFAWNGSAADMETQIANSIRSTMQSDQDPQPDDVKAIAAFLKTLSSPPSIDVARGVSDVASIARGKSLFAKQQCTQCHPSPFYTSPKTYDVGIEDELKHRQFNPPTLLGVGQRGPYFHDGRGKSLRAVFEEHGHQLDSELTSTEMADLLSFLRSL